MVADATGQFVQQQATGEFLQHQATGQAQQHGPPHIQQVSSTGQSLQETESKNVARNNWHIWIVP